MTSAKPDLWKLFKERLEPKRVHHARMQKYAFRVTQEILTETKYLNENIRQRIVCTYIVQMKVCKNEKVLGVCNN
jgi:hypothetical protein